MVFPLKMVDLSSSLRAHWPEGRRRWNTHRNTGRFPWRLDLEQGTVAPRLPHNGLLAGGQWLASVHGTARWHWDSLDAKMLGIYIYICWLQKIGFLWDSLVENAGFTNRSRNIAKIQELNHSELRISTKHQQIMCNQPNRVRTKKTTMVASIPLTIKSSDIPVKSQ